MEIRSTGIPLTHPVQRVAATLFVLTGVLTIGTTLYAFYWSGEPVVSLTAQSGTSAGVPGFRVTEAGPRIRDLGRVVLSPSMNPIRAVLHYSQTGTTVRHYSGATVRILNEEGDEVWSGAHTIATPDDQTTKHANAHVGTFRIVAAEEYRVILDLSEFREDTIYDLSLELRRNVQELNVSLAVMGGVFSGICLLLVIVLHLRESGRNPRPHSGG